MRRRPSALLASVVLGLATACTGPAPDASGGQIYVQVCARCHGADLSGGVGPAIGAGSALAERPDDYISGVVRNGRGAMPAFRATLSDEQIARVVEFIRSAQES